MKDQVKKAPVVDIMTLDFFAKHFNFPVESLRWGVVRFFHDTYDKNGKVIGSEHKCTHLAVLVRGRQLYIDILDCLIRPCLESNICTYDCNVKFVDDKYVFYDGENAIAVGAETIRRCYSQRVFSVETDKYLLGAFSRLAQESVDTISQRNNFLFYNQ